jgi:hypothetical protein
LKKITVTLEEGIIQDITGIPKGVEVEVVDVDMDAPKDDQVRVHTWKHEGYRNTKRESMEKHEENSLD